MMQHYLKNSFSKWAILLVGIVAISSGQASVPNLLRLAPDYKAIQLDAHTLFFTLKNPAKHGAANSGRDYVFWNTTKQDIYIQGMPMSNRGVSAGLYTTVNAQHVAEMLMAPATLKFNCSVPGKPAQQLVCARYLKIYVRAVANDGTYFLQENIPAAEFKPKAKLANS